MTLGGWVSRLGLPGLGLEFRVSGFGGFRGFRGFRGLGFRVHCSRFGRAWLYKKDSEGQMNGGSG